MAKAVGLKESKSWRLIPTSIRLIPHPMVGGIMRVLFVSANWFYKNVVNILMW
jgi:hypothetical protein